MMSETAPTPPSLLRRQWDSFSFIGLVVATLFFAVSLTPSLLPRHYPVQGILSGFALAAGYSIGVGLVLLWRYLELPRPGTRLESVSRRVTGVAVAVVAVIFLWRDTVWQNSIRERMAMEPVASAYPLHVAAIAAVVGLAFVMATRGLVRLWGVVHVRISRVVPRRVSYVLTTLLVVTAVVMFVNRVVARVALHLADRAFLRIDMAVDEGMSAPQDPLACGSPQSLVPWDTIGRQGKEFLLKGPSAETIRPLRGASARQPLRVYAGLGSRETMADRAELALAELQRCGGFERSVLIVATPTGTGWLDPAAVDTVEALHGGDTAIVSMQYSYLPSWITILVDPNRSREAAEALFGAVYGHWKSLPKDRRPRLYLHGLSLGSLGSESSADLFTIFEDPIHGAVWSGPPFPSTVWAHAVEGRNPGTPVWLPVIRDGSMLRFTGRENALRDAGRRWGPLRFVYIQHASDPMVFFRTDLLYRRPEWLAEPRGPDVSPYLRWYPVVTFLQVLFDLPMATSTPLGYGHNYDHGSYIDAWREVTEPAGWTDAGIERLKRHFAEQVRKEASAEGSGT
ncbi:hypothetical protein VT03_31540 [Planctomyces sp. SH-PL14]|nr:hypothetical protein VT03_31540 [Planctomyces sp. SH-PL14]